MKHILAFDDFVLNRSDNTQRVFKQPQWRFDLAYTDEKIHPRGICITSIVPAPDGGVMALYAGVPGVDTPYDDEHLKRFMAWSPDGLHFEPYEKWGASNGYPHCCGGCHEPIGGYAFYDSSEIHPAYRYKSPQPLYGYDEQGKLVEEGARLLVSSDLVHWAPLNDAPVTPSFVDCYPSMLRNPVTGRFQVTTRRRWGERRICLTESEDLTAWSLPRAIVHPLPDDEPTTHLYSMPHCYYAPGDIFIGLLWKQVMPFNRIMDGPMTTELAYSYDGLTWNRTRTSLCPPLPRGSLGSGGSFIAGMVDQGDTICFYMQATRAEHGSIPGGWKPGMPSPRALVPGTLQRNRFVCIDSGKGQAELITQWLRLKKPELTLNANVPFGSLRAELCGAGEGFTLDDFEPLCGDYLDAPLRWK